ncbi:MAG TPA: membrane protein insertion efficiency factor YidD [Actinomycetota bacterium]|nr:membrane protein insertion efficiency factor YidD [Actinomycetota bacterium]
MVGSPVRLVLIGAISAYRLLFAGVLAGRCRFHPSCSAYALEAVRTHGALRGSALAVWRVLRCSPLTAGGLDPVPAPRTESVR